jgi:hypothetical protein
LDYLVLLLTAGVLSFGPREGSRNVEADSDVDLCVPNEDARTSLVVLFESLRDRMNIDQIVRAMTALNDQDILSAIRESAASLSRRALRSNRYGTDEFRTSKMAAFGVAAAAAGSAGAASEGDDDDIQECHVRSAFMHLLTEIRVRSDKSAEWHVAAESLVHSDPSSTPSRLDFVLTPTSERTRKMRRAHLEANQPAAVSAAAAAGSSAPPSLVASARAAEPGPVPQARVEDPDVKAPEVKQQSEAEAKLHLEASSAAVEIIGSRREDSASPLNGCERMLVEFGVIDNEAKRTAVLHELARKFEQAGRYAVAGTAGGSRTLCTAVLFRRSGEALCGIGKVLGNEVGNVPVTGVRGKVKKRAGSGVAGALWRCGDDASLPLPDGFMPLPAWDAGWRC